MKQTKFFLILLFLLAVVILILAWLWSTWLFHQPIG